MRTRASAGHECVLVHRYMAEKVAHLGCVAAALIKRKKGARAEDVLSAIAELEDAR